MRVAVVTTDLSDGGVARATETYLRLFAGLPEVTAVTCIVVDPAPVRFTVPPGVALRQLKAPMIVSLGATPGRRLARKLLRPTLLPYAATALQRAVRRSGADVVVSLGVTPNLLLLLLRDTGLLKRPVIVTEHSDLYSLFASRPDLSRWLKPPLRRLYGQADRLCTVSAAARVSLQRLLGPRDIRVMYTPLDLAAIARQAAEPPALPGWPEDEVMTFVLVARMFPGKGHRALLKVFAHWLRTTGARARLCFIGDGSIRRRLELEAATLRLGPALRFLGYQANPYPYIRRADCLISASELEGFGLTLVEALACGVPVISTDCRSGPREIVAPGGDVEPSEAPQVEWTEHGALVPVLSEPLHLTGPLSAPEQQLLAALARFYEDAELRQRLQDNARAGAERFSEDAIRPRWQALFAEVLGA